MSELGQQQQQQQQLQQQRDILNISTPPVQLEGGGFLVRNVIGSVIKTCDPFLLLDHVGPVDYKPGEALGAPDHPHRGFETVTYVIEGGLKHQDSAGNKGTLKSGWVQWMTAGRGVVHSEMPTDEIMEKGGRSEGFQLWVNLPAKLKMTEPRYQDIPAENIPTVNTEDNSVTVKIIAGESLDVQATIQTHIPILFLDIHLRAGSSFVQTVPESYNGFAYVWKGSGFLGKSKTAVSMGQVGVLSTTGSQFFLQAQEDQDCHVLLIAGEPINEPVVKYGPFVMNTQEEIDQAIKDYQAGLLGTIPGEEERRGQTERAQALQRKNKAL